MKMVFFGSSEFSVYVLNELKLHHILPSLIVTTPDKPIGRKLVLTPTPVKIWAKENGVDVLDPAKLKNNADLIYKLKSIDYDLFLVASYGKIIPKEIFEIPHRKTLNIHPSLLPKYRGASPIQAQILNNEKDIGVTIMEIVEEMDAGPIVIQKKYESVFENSSILGRELEEEIIGRIELEKILAKEGARLFAHILPEWLSGAIDPIPQNDQLATYCSKIKKTDGKLKIDFFDMPKGEEALQNLLKIKAFEEWPGCYTFLKKDEKLMRIVIKSAHIENNTLIINSLIPEGKKEMNFEQFKIGYLNSI